MISSSPTPDTTARRYTGPHLAQACSVLTQQHHLDKHTTATTPVKVTLTLGAMAAGDTLQIWAAVTVTGAAVQNDNHSGQAAAKVHVVYIPF